MFQSKSNKEPIMAMNTKKTSTDANRDPITGTPGAHPVATGIGAALGGAGAGAVAGALGGPVGAVVGAVVGGVAGGLAGTAVGEEVDPTAEEMYWKINYSSRPYYSDDMEYEDISPAYRYGWESRSKYAGKNYQDVESNLKAGWEETEHDVSLGWEKASQAVRDAWDHAPASPRRVAR